MILYSSYEEEAQNTFGNSPRLGHAQVQAAYCQEQTQALSPEMEEGRLKMLNTIYVICTTPRTGSTLLSDALMSTGLAGRPHEYFDTNTENVQHWLKVLNSPIRDYAQNVIKFATTPNDVCGLKLHWHQIRPMVRLFGVGGLPDSTLDEILNSYSSNVKYIWLRRLNRVAQGISYYRASASNVWNVPLEQPKPSIEVPFDVHKIDRHIMYIEEWEENWAHFFEQKGIIPFEFFYEDFVENYRATVEAICSYIDVYHEGINIREPSLHKLSDSSADEWERKYLAKED